MKWNESPTFEQTAKRLGGWLASRHLPIYLGHGVPTHVIHQVGSVWHMNKLELSPTPSKDVKNWPWLKLGEPVIQTSSKQSFLSNIEPYWRLKIDAAPSPTFLNQVGYHPDEKWLEFAAVLPKGRHLTLGDLATLMGFLKNGTGQGQPVTSLRVTFHTRAAAVAEFPWLSDLGVTLQYLAPSGDWRTLSSQNLDDEDEPAPFSYSEEFGRLLDLVAEENWTEIEAARASVTINMLDEAAHAYFELPTWTQKAILIQLIQDKIHPASRVIMHDFLRAQPNFDDDSIWMSKAVALCHLDGSFSQFSTYLDLGNSGVERLAEKRSNQSAP